MGASILSYSALTILFVKENVAIHCYSHYVSNLVNLLSSLCIKTLRSAECSKNLTQTVARYSISNSAKGTMESTDVVVWIGWIYAIMKSFLFYTSLKFM